MAGSSAPILLKTKLHRPTLQTDFVSRPHLVTRLQKGIERKLSLVVAPAGFGKSTLVAGWLDVLENAQISVDGSPLRTCWLSLDIQDDSLPRFLTYVIAAIHTAYATACPILQRTVQSMPLPSIAYLADLLAAELSELEGKLVFVLDDFHHVQSADVQQFLERLLLNAPASLHLVIATRVDPPLPLSRLRVQNQLNEVRAADLRFSVEEAEQFFHRALPITLSTELVRTLDERAEGWVAGLRLAALSLRDCPTPQTLVEEFGGTQRHVMDFLLEQVLAQQSPEVVTFLLFTAPLEMLCAPLCNEVLAAAGVAPSAPFTESGEQTASDSRALLNYLVRSNLFLVPLDSKGHWYRYHHLFRDMLIFWLEAHYSAEIIGRIHRQAAEWFARNGLLEQALRLLLTIKAVEEAGDLVEIAVPPALGRESWPGIKEMLDMLPDAVIDQRPVLLVARAWMYSVLQRMNEVTSILQQVDALQRQTDGGLQREAPPWLEGWVHALWCLDALLRWNMQAAIAHAQKALALTPISHVYVRGITITYYALALRYAGEYAESQAVCARAMEGELEETQHRILSTLGMLSTYEGDLHGVVAAGAQNLAAGGSWKMSKPHGWGRLFLGSVAYETNDLEAAREHFLAAYEDRHGAAIVLALDGAYGMALTLAALGDSNAAAEWADKIATLAQEAENVYLIAISQWFSCRLALQEGKLPPVPSAHLWCVGKMPPFQYRWAEFPDLTYARLLIAQGTRASLGEAVELMQQMVKWCECYHLHWRRIDALAVLALAQATQGREQAALATIAAAINLAQPQPYVRTFVDLGPPMARLLHALAAAGVHPDYVGAILAAFPTATRNSIAVTTAAQRDDEIIEPLSEREMEVLGLLAERLSDKEIAERLRISPLTVRRHSVNLYQKLHVNSRRQAVARAQALGLIRSIM